MDPEIAKRFVDQIFMMKLLEVFGSKDRRERGYMRWRLAWEKPTDARMSGLLWWLHPDGKTQVAIQCLHQADGSVVPWKIHTVVTSTSMWAFLKAARFKEVAAASAGAHRQAEP